MDSNENGMISHEELVTLHDDKGKSAVFHPVDAVEALDTGKWHKDPQEKKKAAAAPEKKEEPEQTENDPEKDDSGVRMAYMAKKYNALKLMAKDVGLNVAANIKKEDLVDMLIAEIEK